MWIQENRNSITHLDVFGIAGVSLMPNAIKRVIDTPAIREAIKANFVKEVFPIWSENGKAITGYIGNMPIILFDDVEEIVEEGDEE